MGAPTFALSLVGRMESHAGTRDAQVHRIQVLVPDAEAHADALFVVFVLPPRQVGARHFASSHMAVRGYARGTRPRNG